MLYQLLEDPSDPRNKDSKVVGIEHVSELVEWSVGNLRKDGLGSALDKGQIKMIAGDGRKGMYSTAAHTLYRRVGKGQGHGGDANGRRRSPGRWAL